MAAVKVMLEFAITLKNYDFHSSCNCRTIFSCIKICRRYEDNI